mmetsp:Transcript_18295/g.23169  ORF Transcript_18295/g.23169 Transcript_18295/m.23169 type:complete len:138 (-) Transcript_18295:126-539(-)
MGDASAVKWEGDNTPVAEEKNEVPDDLLREDLVKQREALLIRRLSQKSLKDKQIRARRAKSTKVSLSKSCDVTPSLDPAGGTRKPRPKSATMTAVDGAPLTQEEKEKRRELLLEKKKKLLMLQKLKAKKLAQSKQKS